MEYRQDKLTIIAIGLILAFIGVMNLAFGITFIRDQGAFLVLLGILLICGSIASFTYKSIVKIDSQTKCVEKTLGALFWSKSKSCNFSDFHKVGITTGTRGGTGPIRTVYFVQLVGKDNLSIPGMSSDCGKISQKADEIAKMMDLPFDEDPKMGFFGKRI